MTASSFDPLAILAKVKGLAERDPNSIEECRNILVEQIFDWSDYFTEHYSDSPQSEPAQRLAASLLELWLGFADFEVSLRQYKKAGETYEKAMGDPIVGKSERIYCAYAEYCVGRGRPATAQKAYLSGLTAGIPDAQANEKLWRNLLQLLHDVNKSTSLTMEELYANVVKQVADPSLLPSAPSAQAQAQAQGLQVKLEPMHQQQQEQQQQQQQQQHEAVPMEVAESKEEDGLEEGLGLGGLTPEQIVRAYRLRPPMLFVAPNKEPMLSALSSAAGMQSVDDALLDALEALWCAQALKERHFESWISQLNALHRQQEAELVQKHAADAERRRLSSRCAVQRELLHAIINKTMFGLLIEQQTLLADLRCPGFTVSFTDSLLSAPRSNMLAAGTIATFFDTSITAHIADQQRTVCALLSSRFHAAISQVSGGMQRGLSTDSEGLSDYYSPASKKMRSRRRSVAAGKPMI